MRGIVLGLALRYRRGLDTEMIVEYEGVSGEETVRNNLAFDTQSTWPGPVS